MLEGGDKEHKPYSSYRRNEGGRETATINALFTTDYPNPLRKFRHEALQPQAAGKDSNANSVAHAEDAERVKEVRPAFDNRSS